jgi:hypothetical protein
MLKFTSAITGCGFWIMVREIAGLEPWEPGFLDITGLVPDTARSLVRLNCGLVLPILEDTQTALKTIEGKI